MFRPALFAAALAMASTALHAEPRFWSNEWPDTDFSTNSIDSDWVQIMSGGPPKDGIPALSDPGFIAVADETRITDREPVITLEIEGEVPRAARGNQPAGPV